MKLFVTLVCLLAALASAAQASATQANPNSASPNSASPTQASPAASMGAHGMVLFGGPQGLYASHLPMFHAPHNYQVILQLHLADAAQERALRTRLGRSNALWTLDPEPFALERFAAGASAPLRAFKADLVLGHFEQGGTVQYRGAAVIVERVLVFRQLQGSPSQPALARYFQIGTGNQRFLVKQIDRRPDFDHIVAIGAAPRTPATDVALDIKGLAQPLDAAFVHALPGIAVRGTVYFSGADLR